ncbi:MAG: hypothetical protein DRQ39_02225 [Gammaproteobacteria bacterium]|nr:MAG: hypothetical protein DRQ39_02225 [Gammaproteobacteria bacterium]
MSNSIASLKKLLLPSADAAIGTVVVDKGSVLQVATPTGLKDIPKSNSIRYAIGGDVRIFNGVAVGKVVGDETLPQYFV